MRLQTFEGPIGRDSAVRLFLTGLVLLSLGQRVRGQGCQPSDPAAAERASLLSTMRGIAQSIAVSELSGEKRSQLRLADEPVLRYADNTRKSHDSTIWVFVSEGRPSAILSVEHYTEGPGDTNWLFEIASLSPNRISVERGKKELWTARKPGLRMQALADAPPPATKPAARFAQMKQLLRRFTAHERAVVEGRIELRPMANPLYRYGSEVAGDKDGAVFSFASGTNPEVLLILEAQPNGEEGSGWQFSLAQMTGAEAFAELDGEQVWQCPEADPPAARDSYFNAWFVP